MPWQDSGAPDQHGVRLPSHGGQVWSSSAHEVWQSPTNRSAAKPARHALLTKATNAGNCSGIAPRRSPFRVRLAPWNEVLPGLCFKRRWRATGATTLFSSRTAVLQFRRQVTERCVSCPVRIRRRSVSLRAPKIRPRQEIPERESLKVLLERVIPAYPRSARSAVTGLSRRRSRVRVPSLPSSSAEECVGVGLAHVQSSSGN